MMTFRLLAKGPRTRELPRAVQAALPRRNILFRQLGVHAPCELFDYQSVVIVVCEQYFIRIKSQIVLTVVFSFENDHTCSIRLISGGGQKGAVMLDWGAEENALDRGIKIIRDLARSMGMEVETQ